MGGAGAPGDWGAEALVCPGALLPLVWAVQGRHPDWYPSPPQVTTVKFWFATGGAGFCLSRGLALKMSPWAR